MKALRPITAYTHTYIHTYMHTYIHVCIHTYMYAYIHFYFLIEKNKLPNYSLTVA